MKCCKNYPIKRFLYYLMDVINWSNEYQGIILFTKARLYLYELMHTDDSKAKTNADVISSKVKSLKDKSIKVISACCDNCKTNIKGLNFDSNSAQEEI